MTPELAAGIRDFIVQSLETEYRTTRRVIASIPDDRVDYAPDDASTKALPLAWHIASSELFFLNGVSAGAFDFSGGERPEEVTTASAVLAWQAQHRPAVVERVRSLSGDQLLKVIDFRGMVQWPAINFLQLALSHLVHHRGQLSAYLRPMGAKVPSIYGPSGDQPVRSGS